MIKGIKFVNIPVSDQERALAFYTEKLGFAVATNQPMGPLLLADFVGLDTLHSILQILHRELGEDKYRPCPLLTKYVEAGWYGKKVGRGFYKYQ